MSQASNPDVTTGNDNIDRYLNEIDHDLAENYDPIESDDFKEFIKDAQAREICTFSTDPVLAALEQYCAMAAVSESKHRQLAAAIKDLQQKVDAQKQWLLKELDDSLQAQILNQQRAEEERKRLEEEEKARKKAEEEAKKEQEPADAPEEQAPPQPEGEQPQEEAAGEPPVPQEAPAEDEVNPDDDIDTQIEKKKKKLDEVELQRIRNSEGFKRLEGLSDELTALDSLENNWNRLMSGVQGLARADCSAEFEKAIRGGESSLYKKPINLVYQSLNRLLTEKVKELEEKLSKLIETDNTNARLGSEISALKDQVGNLNNEKEALLSEIKKIEDLKFAIEQARETEARLKQAIEEKEALEVKIDFEKKKNNTLDTEMKAIQEKIFKDRQLLDDRLRQLDTDRKSFIEESKNGQNKLESEKYQIGEKMREIEREKAVVEALKKDLQARNAKASSNSRSVSPRVSHMLPLAGGRDRSFRGREEREENTSSIFGGRPDGLQEGNSVRAFSNLAQGDLNRSGQASEINILTGDIEQVRPADSRTRQDLNTSAIDLAVQRQELQREREKLVRDKDDFKVEKAQLHLDISESQHQKLLLKEKDQIIEKLHRQLSTANYSIMQRGYLSLLQENTKVVGLAGIFILILAYLAFSNYTGSQYPRRDA